MAQPALRLPENVPGDFFVDSTCIDCDACRIFAPMVFSDDADQSFVFHQPESEEELLAAQKALVSCPTSSIGSATGARAAVDALPEHIEDDVYRCGYAAESSFGAIAYFLRDREILIDSPRFAGPLVKKLTNVRRLLLTHQDDIADHAKFRERFGCERVLHFDDARGRTFELMPRGLDPIDLGDDVLMIPTPGHTKGHAVFLYREKYLFTGDHLAWSPRRGHLYAFRSACWYSWTEQIRSMERLLDYSFEWVLPGHGRPIRLTRSEMRASLEQCVGWMKGQR
ncbi:MAG TPA: MBL fold metallo-hydrolase [Thermoanaerobaculia bacterium]|jgi:glyoxylase-like metal-dependent hydrolase (beta-lactamase superfamily II)/ferredoxin